METKQKSPTETQIPFTLGSTWVYRQCQNVAKPWGRLHLTQIGTGIFVRMTFDNREDSIKDSIITHLSENVKEIQFENKENATDEYSTSFYLRSEHILSERIIERFNRMTSFIVESGIHDFYWSMAEYLMELKRAKPVSSSFDSFSLDNIVSLFLMFLVSLGVALLAFLMEVVWFHAKNFTRIRNVTGVEFQFQN